MNSHTTYTTAQGDTWDALSLKFYNAENYMHYLLDANPQYNDILVFPANVILEVPEIEVKKNNDLAPVWRKGGS